MEQVQQSTQRSGLWLTMLVISSWERAFVGQTETQGASSQWRQVIGIENSKVGNVLHSRCVFSEPVFLLKPKRDSCSLNVQLHRQSHRSDSPGSVRAGSLRLSL